MASTSIDFKDKRVVLLLQGGGALGGYQVGAYEALEEALSDGGRSGVDWVGGISIGAVNAAVIAGPKHPSPTASAELNNLWHDIVSPPYPPFDYTKVFETPVHYCWLQPLIAKYWNWSSAAFGPLGQGNFFSPRPAWYPWFSQWFGPSQVEQLGCYDTTPLHDTLNEHVNWSQINEAGKNKERRLLLGVTSVTDGELRFLDSFAAPVAKRQHEKFIPVTMSADCVRASGAIPPSFPPVRIGDDTYFDGGVSSNTLITELQDEFTTKDTIVFLLDLWDRKGQVPQSMDEVMWRQKCIQFGSRKQAAESVVERHQMRARYAKNDEPQTKLEVCQVMFESNDPSQFGFSDADFSAETFEKMHNLGRRDMQRMLEHPDRVEVEGATAPITDTQSYAALYRVGTLDKHRRTDRELARVSA